MNKLYKDIYLFYNKKAIKLSNHYLLLNLRKINATQKNDKYYQII